MNETCYNMVYEVMLPIGRTPHTLSRYEQFKIFTDYEKLQTSFQLYSFPSPIFLIRSASSRQRFAN